MSQLKVRDIRPDQHALFPMVFQEHLRAYLQKSRMGSTPMRISMQMVALDAVETIQGLIDVVAEQIKIQNGEPGSSLDGHRVGHYVQPDWLKPEKDET